MPSDTKPRILCSCGCGRKFVPVRYTHRYATRECYQIQYQKDNPVTNRLSDNKRIRTYSIPEIPSDWVSLTQAEHIFGVTFSTLKDDRLKKMIRKRDGVEGFSTYEIVSYFIQNSGVFSNVYRRMQRFEILRPCHVCGKSLPGLRLGGTLTCGECLNATNRLADVTEKKEPIVSTEEHSVSSIPIAEAAGALNPLLRLLESLCMRIGRVEKRLNEFEFYAQEPMKSVDADQLIAEIGYLKEAIRKATTLVEDQGIRSTAIDARLARLEKDLGVTK